jgi:GT2 family glycosyltransferase
MQNQPQVTEDVADPLLDLPFDHYERYALSRTLVEAIRTHLSRPQLRVLDAGGAPGSLAEFLPADWITTADLLAADNPGHVIADGSALPFQDGAFDVVTSHDTLEHVRKDRRNAFLLELVRVASDCVIVNGPFLDPRVEEAERLVSQITKDSVGDGHPTLQYLGEHAELGLPRLDETLALIDQLGFLHTVVPNGPLDEWLVKMTIKHHLTALMPYGLRPHEFDQRSNAAYIPSTSRGPSYRQAVIISKRNDARLLQLLRERLSPTSPSHGRDDDLGVSAEMLSSTMDHYLSLIREGLATKDRHISNIDDVVKELRSEMTREKRALNKKDVALQEKDTLLAQQGGLLTQKEAELAEKDSHIVNIETALHRANLQVASSNHQLQQIRNSVGYRLLEQARRPIRWLAPEATRRRLVFTAFSRGMNVIITRGPIAFFGRLIRVWEWLPDIRRGSVVAAHPSLDDQYQLWLKAHAITPAQAAQIRRKVERLTYRPLVSIIMPTYNTDPAWLLDAIQSVQEQLYDNWELCIADDGSRHHGVRDLLDQQAKADQRIKVTYLRKNQGIAAASNAALSLAIGEFIGLLDHDDELKPDALFEVVSLLNERRDLDYIYSDEDKKDPDGRLVDPFFKPDWSPDLQMSVNYVSHLSVFRKALVDQFGGFRRGYDGSQDYDLVLRITEATDKVAHIAKPLYTWRKIPGSAAASVEAKGFAYRAATKALKDSLARRGLQGRVLDGLCKTHHRVKYGITENPRVSVIIPTRDRVQMLRQCIESIRKKSTYRNYGIVVVDNASREQQTLDYLSSLTGKVIRYPHEFNYAKIVNLAAREADGSVLIFLNNDTEVISPEWIEAMLEHGQRPEVAAVGARLFYPDGRVQHEGIVMGLGGGSAGNVDHGGYFALGECIHNCTAVTGACMLTRSSVFWELGGFDERLRVAFNDVDFCLRAQQKGHRIVYTPFATLYHHESASRGSLHPEEDEKLFRTRWGKPGEYRDPYYNSNLDLRHPFSLLV